MVEGLWPWNGLGPEFAGDSGIGLMGKDTRVKAALR